MCVAWMDLLAMFEALQPRVSASLSASRVGTCFFLRSLSTLNLQSRMALHLPLSVWLLQ